MRIKYLLFCCCVMVLFGSFNPVQPYPPADRQATTETYWLYSSLQRLMGAGVIFGHHDDLAYGVGWRGDKNRSDIKSVTGSYPALYGWDLAGLELDSSRDINHIPFKLQAKYVKEVYRRGGINTFCWHLHSPVDGKTAWDVSVNTVKQIIPGGTFHNAYIVYLSRIANYIKTLKGDEGEPIPLLFRPFHELTGTWFWWGKNTCTPEDFKTLWRFTVDYLRNTQKLHNLLLVYSVADFNTPAEFIERYPGDGYVDVVGFDSYCTNGVGAFVNDMDKRLTITQNIAIAHHKLSAIAETGYEQLPQTDWWTSELLPLLTNHPVSYMMIWRNDSPGQYYAPYPGQPSADDFARFFDSGQVLFQDKLTGLGVYGKYILH